MFPITMAAFEAMLEQEDLDVVSICTSNDAHHPAALAAMARGLHVFCEKPLALNFAQALEMYNVAQSQGVVTGINFTYRTFPAARYVKELTEEGIFGDIKHFSIEYFQSYSVNPNRTLEWRFQKKLTGTGALADLGSHATDLTLWIAGGISGVRGHMATFIHERPLQDGFRHGHCGCGRLYGIPRFIRERRHWRNCRYAFCHRPLQPPTNFDLWRQRIASLPERAGAPHRGCPRAI